MTQRVLSRFRDVVPRWVQVVAAVLFGVAVLAAFELIFAEGFSDGRASAGFGDMSMAGIAGASGVMALFSALWLMALGFVYGDARRRGMSAWLWTLVVMFTPNLIGFFLYFALRHPLLAPCGSCGGGVAGGQRFCSVCGAAQSFSTLNPVVAGAEGLGTAGIAAPARQGSRLSFRSFSTGFAVWTGIFLAKSLFAYLKHDLADSAVLFGFAAIGFVLLMFAHRKSTYSR